MTSIFRRKVTCFYCGQHSVPPSSAKQYSNGRVRHFSCPHCNADNHLDKNGDILDYVPELPTNPPPQFARRCNSPRSFATTPTTGSFTTAVEPALSPPAFCRNCQNNQIIVNNAIASYPLPPEDHPDYELHINDLFPKHRASLEERWPPVCSECAPKVNDRIRISNYQAKVASLGQMLARSNAATGEKSGGIDKWKALETVVWYARGTVWIYMTVLMLVWHASAMLRSAPVLSDIAPSWASCLVNSFARSEVDAACYEVSAASAAKYIPFGFLGFFWIYRERGLAKYPEKRLVGGKEYLRLEVFVLVVRMLSWWILAPGGWAFTDDAFRKIHMGLFFISMMSTLFSLTCLKLENPPTFSLREPQPIPAVLTPPLSPSQARPSQPAIPPHQLVHPNTPLRPQQRLPPSLANPTYSSDQYRSPQRGYSPSPSPMKNAPFSPDAMDWNPTSPTPESIWRLQSQKPIPQPAFTSSSSSSFRQSQYESPFIGSLPPAPKPPLYRISSALMNPPPSAQNTPSTQLVREQFFSHRLPSSSSQTTINTSTQQPPQPSNPKYAPLAPQKFFVREEPTGLEGLFGPGLKLDDDPDVFYERCQQQAQTHEEPLSETLARATLLLFSAGTIIFLSSSTKNNNTTTKTFVAFKTLSLLVTTLCIIWKTLRALPPTSAIIRKLIATTEIAACLLLTLLTTAAGVRAPAVETATVSWILAHEFWNLLMRLQRCRAREFYEKERRKVLDSGVGGAGAGAGAGAVAGAVAGGGGQKMELKREPSSSSSLLGAGGLNLGPKRGTGGGRAGAGAGGGGGVGNRELVRRGRSTLSIGR